MRPPQQPLGETEPGYLQLRETELVGQLAVLPHTALHLLHHRLQPQLEFVHVGLVTLMLPGHLLQQAHSVLWEGGESAAMRVSSLAALAVEACMHVHARMCVHMCVRVHMHVCVGGWGATNPRPLC